MGWLYVLIQGWVYLAVILDLFSRTVIDWDMSKNIDRHLIMLCFKNGFVAQEIS